MTLKLKWGSKVPQECDLCHNKIKKTFIDGRTYGGQWGYMCSICHGMNGVGLGTGRGQKYQLDSSDNQFYKVGP